MRHKPLAGKSSPRVRIRALWHRAAGISSEGPYSVGDEARELKREASAGLGSWDSRNTPVYVESAYESTVSPPVKRPAADHLFAGRSARAPDHAPSFHLKRALLALPRHQPISYSRSYATGESRPDCRADRARIMRGRYGIGCAVLFWPHSHDRGNPYNNLPHLTRKRSLYVLSRTLQPQITAVSAGSWRVGFCADRKQTDASPNLLFGISATCHRLLNLEICSNPIWMFSCTAVIFASPTRTAPTTPKPAMLPKRPAP